MKKILIMTLCVMLLTSCNVVYYYNFTNTYKPAPTSSKIKEMMIKDSIDYNNLGTLDKSKIIKNNSAYNNIKTDTTKN